MKYDIAVSFAGEDREIVKKIVDWLSFCGLTVFYDTWETHEMLGVDLYTHLAEIYSKEATYCLVFCSENYGKKMWTRHELKSVQSRSITDNPKHIIPIKIDDTEIPGIPNTIGSLDARKLSPSAIALTISKKIGNIDNQEYSKFIVASKKMTFEVFENGSIDCAGELTLIKMGTPSNYYVPELWSPDGNPLVLKSFDAWDEKGPLECERLFQNKSQAMHKVIFRKELKHGDAVSYHLRYACDQYFQDFSSLCKDSFSMAVNVKYWDYEFVFPKNFEVEEFHFHLESKKNTFRQSYRASKRDGKSVMTCKLESPPIGSLALVKFKILKVDSLLK